MSLVEFMTLTETSKVAPGRPSVNCLWRWCRRGVKSRSGARVQLEHRRVGGKILTTKDWLDSFLLKLTNSDTEYFSSNDAASHQMTLSRDSRYASPTKVARAAKKTRDAAAAEIDTAIIAELAKEGL